MYICIYIVVDVDFRTRNYALINCCPGVINVSRNFSRVRTSTPQTPQRAQQARWCAHEEGTKKRQTESCKLVEMTIKFRPPPHPILTMYRPTRPALRPSPPLHLSHNTWKPIRVLKI